MFSMFGRTGALTQRAPPHGPPSLTLSQTLTNSDHNLNPNTRWHLTHPLILALVNTPYPIPYFQCPEFQKTAEGLVSKYIRGLLSGCGSTGMLTCLWWQLCVRRHSGNWATVLRQEGPHIFSEQGPTWIKSGSAHDSFICVHSSFLEETWMTISKYR